MSLQFISKSMGEIFISRRDRQCSVPETLCHVPPFFITKKSTLAEVAAPAAWHTVKIGVPTGIVFSVQMVSRRLIP
jgi:hypothetical protein